MAPRRETSLFFCTRLVFCALFAPSCGLYDAGLLEGAVGGEESGDPGLVTGGTGPDGAGAGGGAAMGAGGNSATGGRPAGSASGGAGPESGGAGVGGAEPTGGGPSAGGSTAVCTAPGGEKGEWVDVGETSLVEDFDRAWAAIGAGAKYTGQWHVAVDPAGTGIPAAIQDSHDEDPCASSGDHALHVKGSGYETWGASFDANLMFDVAEVDLSAFIGVTFWARSDDSDQIKIGFSDADDGNGDTPIEAAPLFIGATWEQHWVEFPAAVAKDRMTILHVVAIADAEFDFWLDDLTLYAAPP